MSDKPLIIGTIAHFDSQLGRIDIDVEAKAEHMVMYAHQKDTLGHIIDTTGVVIMFDNGSLLMFDDNLDEPFKPLIIEPKFSMESNRDTMHNNLLIMAAKDSMMRSVQDSLKKLRPEQKSYGPKKRKDWL